jgi:hypothetical protein
VSVVVANGSVYRSTWNRGVDAVSACADALGAARRDSCSTRAPCREPNGWSPSPRATTTSAPARPRRSRAPRPWSETCTAGGETFTLQPSAARSRTRRVPMRGRWPCARGCPCSIRQSGRRARLPQPGHEHGRVARDRRAERWMRATARGSTAHEPRHFTRMSLAKRRDGAGLRMRIAGLPVVGFMVRTFENGTSPARPARARETTAARSRCSTAARSRRTSRRSTKRVSSRRASPARACARTSCARLVVAHA